MIEEGGLEKGYISVFSFPMDPIKFQENRRSHRYLGVSMDLGIDLHLIASRELDSVLEEASRRICVYTPCVIGGQIDRHPGARSAKLLVPRGIDYSTKFFKEDMVIPDLRVVDEVRNNREVVAYRVTSDFCGKRVFYIRAEEMDFTYFSKNRRFQGKIINSNNETGGDPIIKPMRNSATSRSVFEQNKEALERIKSWKGKWWWELAA